MKVKKYFEESPVFQIIHLGRQSERHITNSLKDFDLSYFQSLILISIDVENASDITVSELANIFPITKGAISQNISILESKSLVKRKISSDKRRSSIQITSKGSKVALTLISLFEDLEQFYEKNLSCSHLKEIQQLNLKLTL